MAQQPSDLVDIPERFWTRSDTRQALRERDVGALFQLVRKHTGASQTRIGMACGGISQGEVSEIMRHGGRRVTSIELLERVADGLRLPDQARRDLGLAPCDSRHGELASEGSPENNASPEIELLRRLQQSASVDPKLVNVLRDETENLRLLDRRFGARTLTANMHAHITHIETTLRHALAAKLRQPLATVLADTSALAGWQAIDMRRLPEAWQHFERAKLAAHEAGDSPLCAFAAGEQSYVLLDLEQPEDALALVTETYESHHARMPARLLTWLKAAEAEMAAAMHDEVRCRRALADAARALPCGEADSDLPYLALNEVHLARWRANCLVHFGDVEAVDDLRKALRVMGGMFTRAEASLRCDLARALTALGEQDEARLHLRQARQLAELTGSARQRRRIEQVAVAA